MEPSPPPLPNQQAAPPRQAPANSFPRQAARFSLWAPIASICISVVFQQAVRGHRLAMIIVGLTSVLLVFAGLVLGIIALISTKRHGFAGILGKALAGTCINGLLVVAMLLAIPGLIKAAERTKAIQQQQQIEQQSAPQ